VLIDIDGNREDRHDTVSVFNGPAPTILSLKSEPEKIDFVAERLTKRQAEGLNPHEIGLFVRSAAQIERAQSVVMACDDEVVPLQERIEHVSDESDLQEVYDTERHLLYVACTRARDYLLVTSVDPGSEFLDDMGQHQ